MNDTENTSYAGLTAEPPSPPAAAEAPPLVSAPAQAPRPYVTYALIAVTTLVYLGQLASEAILGFDILVALGAKINEFIAAGEVWRLLTPILLHGSLLHIGFNMYALYIFGPRMEFAFGRWRFIALYLLSGFAGNVFSLMFTQAPSVGSSTAIFGLLGAYGVYIHHNRRLFGEAGSRASLNSIIRIAAINLVIGLSPGIDNWGHVGGLLGGGMFAWLAGPLLTVQGITPPYRLGDRRTTEAIWQAVALTAGLFGALAAGALYWIGR